MYYISYLWFFWFIGRWDCGTHTEKITKIYSEQIIKKIGQFSSHYLDTNNTEYFYYHMLLTTRGKYFLKSIKNEILAVSLCHYSF